MFIGCAAVDWLESHNLFTSSGVQWLEIRNRHPFPNLHEASSRLESHNQPLNPDGLDDSNQSDAVQGLDNTVYNRPAAAHRLEIATLAAAVVIALGVPLVSGAVALPGVAAAASYASVWDREDRLIRATRDAGQADVTVPPLPAFLGEDFVTPDRTNWFNVCVARYYGVRTIAAEASS